MEKAVLHVEGMSCNHCKMTVERALQDIGVKAVVDLQKKTVALEFDAAAIKLEQVVNEIEEQGYTVKQ